MKNDTKTRREMHTKMDRWGERERGEREREREREREKR